MDFIVDKENKKIKIQRKFNAPVAKVWAAWTKSELLDQWWAPKPWQAKTKEMNFTEGGHWLYVMVGPAGEEHWAKIEFNSINELKSFSGKDAFCDENGNVNEAFPRSIWENEFTDNLNSTIVSSFITFNELSDLEKIIEMGFKEGFMAAQENLDNLLK